MASPSLAARAAILGVPYQAGKRPDPLGVVKAIEALDAKAMATSAGAIVRDTLVDLNAVSNPPAHQMGWVTGDGTSANNGIYENAGSPSAPNWQRRADLPFGVIHMINVGAGTADAIVATSSLPAPVAPGAALFTINIAADNTGPVTINGKPLLTNSGNEIVPGGLTASSISVFIDLGDHFRLLSDQASASIVAAAEDAAERAETAAAGVEFPVSYGLPQALSDQQQYQAQENIGVFSLLRERVSILKYGAVGDFDPSTGSGHDDRTAIRAAVDHMMGLTRGGVLVIPPGDYYLGSGYEDASVTTQLFLGQKDGPGLNKVDIEGYRATIYPGAPGRALVFANSVDCSVRGLSMVGYAGGAISPARERDACLATNYNSRSIKFRDLYLTNSLGDCIYIGGSFVDGGQNGYESRDISVKECILKERYGDGVRSYDGGTRSRLAVAVIDAIGVEIEDNIIYGAVDLEPNLDGQHLINVNVDKNKFRSGFVAPQSVIGTDYWHDEPLYQIGGTAIEQAIHLTGRSGSPVISGCTANDNKFEKGYIREGNPYRFDSVSRNEFQRGQIRLGGTTGSNSTHLRKVRGNTAESLLDGEIMFIKLAGMVYHTVFDSNIVNAPSGFVISNDGPSTGDGGRCVYSGNVNVSATASGVLGHAIAATSVDFGSLAVNHGRGTAEISEAIVKTLRTPIVSVPLSGASEVLNWNTYGGNKWITSQAGGAADSISNIVGAIPEGTELLIISGASGGGSSTTFIHASGTMRLKGGVNAVLAGGDSIRLIRRSTIWQEVGRSF